MDGRWHFVSTVPDTSTTRSPKIYKPASRIVGFLFFHLFFFRHQSGVPPCRPVAEFSSSARTLCNADFARTLSARREIPSSARKQVVCRLFEHGEQYDQSARQRQEASNPWWSARVSLHPSTLPPHILLRLCRKHYLQKKFILIFPHHNILFDSTRHLQQPPPTAVLPCSPGDCFTVPRVNTSLPNVLLSFGLLFPFKVHKRRRLQQLYRRLGLQRQHQLHRKSTLPL